MHIIFLVLLMLVVGCSHSPSLTASATAESRQPEGASGLSAQPGWHGQKFAIATANPLASAAGLAMLKDGGTAIDAAVAAQIVLTLVEPQSSGIGGGAFLLHHDGRQTVAFEVARQHQQQPVRVCSSRPTAK